MAASSGRWPLHDVHVFMDKICKYVVAATTVHVTVTNTPWDGASVLVPVVTTMFAITGLIGKLLKRLLRQSRPSVAVKGDPGMPSSHAVALSYLSWAVALGISCRSDWRFGTGSDAATAALCIVLGVYWTSLRVYIGHHTVLQVLAGYLLGALSCIAVFAINFSGVASHVGRFDLYTTQQERVMCTHVMALFCCAVLMLAGKKWYSEDFRQKKAL